MSMKQIDMVGTVTEEPEIDNTVELSAEDKELIAEIAEETPETQHTSDFQSLVESALAEVNQFEMTYTSYDVYTMTEAYRKKEAQKIPDEVLEIFEAYEYTTVQTLNNVLEEIV